MVEALCHELKLQKDYLNDEIIKTIYFGGGTPSLLSGEEISVILRRIDELYNVENGCEITLEANPDDLSRDKLAMLYQSGINRLSIGIQTFDEESLKFLNRAHDTHQALKCVEDARHIGFNNISIDLIYALPSPSHDLWLKDLDTAMSLKPEHISSYCLTIEPQTAFGSWLKKGNIPPIDEEHAASQFEMLIDRLVTEGYEQYEVSNFCKPGFHSKHNSGYWKRQNYLGVGPSAHSYDGRNRQFNISHNPKYIKSISENKVPFELDELSLNDRINDYLLTTLRTKWGAELFVLKNEWGYDLLSENNDYIKELINRQHAEISEGALKLTSSGLLFADKISSDLFKV